MSNGIIEEVKQCIDHAQSFVEEGILQIINGEIDENHGVSVSPGATALASLSLLALGKGYEQAQRQGIDWLMAHQRNWEWGKVLDGEPDSEVTRIAQVVIQGSRGGLLSKLSLLEHAKELSDLVLTLGEEVVPGLQGPTTEEITFPNILEQAVLQKLPLYGRPVIIAASLLATPYDTGVEEGIQYLFDHQMPDGSWAEDIVATSICVLALFRFNRLDLRIHRAGRWLVQKQYSSGGWPAFDQLKIWAIAWALTILERRPTSRPELFEKARGWLIQAGNADGSFGTSPPFTHPDFDDTAIALMALPVNSKIRETTSELLLRLQNEDGSWGTFPDFVGRPPKITSHFPAYIQSLDVTVHVVEAITKQGIRDPKIFMAIRWILSQQKKDGQFQSVWFDGPIYGTAQIINLLEGLKFGWSRPKLVYQASNAYRRGIQYLLQTCTPEGEWGSSVSETALALYALKHVGRNKLNFERTAQCILACQTEKGSFQPVYQGVYAKGWNYEEPISTALTVIRALDWYVSQWGTKR